MLVNLAVISKALHYL